MNVTISYGVHYDCVVKPKSCSDKLRSSADMSYQDTSKKIVATEILLFDFELFIGDRFDLLSNKGTILRLFDCSHVAGLSLGAPSFYIVLKQKGPIPNQYKPRIDTNLFDYRLSPQTINR